MLPPYIINEIIYNHLFIDIYDKFPRFFKPKSKEIARLDEMFLIDISTGLKPRMFYTYDKNDS